MMSSQQKLGFKAKKPQQEAQPQNKTRSASAKRKRDDEAAAVPAQGVSGEEATNDMSLTEEDRMLMKFDLAMKYGPCVGITRLERWERAERFGLSPPEEVREVLQRYAPDHAKQRAVWSGRV